MALFFFLGIIGLVIAGYILGSSLARLFRRSQVRFFRSYRHCRLLSMALMPKADALSSWELIFRQESLRAANR